MINTSSIGKYVNDMMKRISAIDGTVVGKDMQISKTRLAKDVKGAMVNDIVDKYLRKELDAEYLKQIKAEFSISDHDLVKEISKREIEKALGK